MYNKISKLIANEMYSQNLISESQISICIYCFNYLFENILFLSFILIYGFITRNLYFSFSYIAILYAGRKFCGGAHFSSSKLCFIFSYGTVLLSPFLISLYKEKYILYSAIFATICILYLLNVCPVFHPNKKFTGKNINSLKRMCRIYLFFVFILLLLLYITKRYRIFFYCCLCLSILTINCLIGKKIYTKSCFTNS